MSTKTVALEVSVYEKLARRKRGSESFTRAIDRLIEQAADGTCAAAVEEASALWRTMGPDAVHEADRMEQALRELRQADAWSVERPE